jgi:hypothetical protein
VSDIATLRMCLAIAMTGGMFMFYAHVDPPKDRLDLWASVAGAALVFGAALALVLAP